MSSSNSTDRSKISDRERMDLAAKRLAGSLSVKKRIELLKWLGDMEYMKSNDCPKEERYGWLEKSYNHLKQAYKLKPEDPYILCALASATGRLAEESDFQAKMRLGFEFKDYLDKAIKMDDKDNPDHSFELYHMRGRLAYTVITLPLMERLFATTLGCVPSFTVDDAITDLKKAAQLHPNVPENELFVAKCLIHKGDTKKAIHYLNKTINCSCDLAIEDDYIKEAEDLLVSLLLK